MFRQGWLLMCNVLMVMVGGRIMVGFSLLSNWNIARVGKFRVYFLL